MDATWPKLTMWDDLITLKGYAQHIELTRCDPYTIDERNIAQDYVKNYLKHRKYSDNLYLIAIFAAPVAYPFGQYA